MSTDTGWHVDQGLLTAYAAGRLDHAGRWSVEAHVTGSDRCRRLATQDGLVPGERLDAIWQQVTAEVDAPRPGPVERLLLAAVVLAIAAILAVTVRRRRFDLGTGL